VSFKVGEGREFELIERSDDPEYDRVRFQVGFEVEDIERAREELIRRGAKPITGIQGEETPWVYFTDPEGSVFEIKQRLRRGSLDRGGDAP
jgi:hypothetical protein